MTLYLVFICSMLFNNQRCEFFRECIASVFVTDMSLSSDFMSGFDVIYKYTILVLYYHRCEFIQ